MRAKQILYIIYVTVLEHEQITTVRKYRFRIMLNYDLVPPPAPQKKTTTKKYDRTTPFHELVFNKNIPFVWNIIYFPWIS